MVAIGVGQGHVADAERVIVVQQAQAVLDRVASFDSDECCYFVFLLGAPDIRGGGGQGEIVGIPIDDVVAYGIDHLQSAVGGLVGLHVAGGDIGGEELGAHAAYVAAS